MTSGQRGVALRIKVDALRLDRIVVSVGRREKGFFWKGEGAVSSPAMTRIRRDGYTDETKYSMLDGVNR